jgi:ferredoxin
MKVSIDNSKCVVCMSCIAMCPEVFEMKENGTIGIVPAYDGVDITDEVLQQKVRDASGACPAMAIVIEE